MEQLNTFSKGMNKDLSKTFFKEGAYIHAENFSLVTDVGLSTASLRNIKGNTSFMQIPIASEVISLQAVNIPTPAATQTITIDALGTLYTFSFLYDTTWKETLANQINSDIQLDALGIKAAYTNERLVIYCQVRPGANNQYFTNVPVIPVQSSTIDIFISTIANTVQGSIMGWGTIRDQIFLFTAESIVPSATAQGQIWKITYDKFSEIPVLSLLYHGKLNFSMSHPIPNPGGVIGNLEIPQIQNLYWTDNYNRPRKINTADPNLMAVAVGNIDMGQDYFGGNIVPQLISTGGSLPVGCYSVTYRLKSNAGTTGYKTSYFVPSNPLPIIDKPETSAIQDYWPDLINQASPANSSKKVDYTIYNLDTNFTYLDIVSIYRTSEDATPDINIVYTDLPVPSSGILNFSLTGNETKIPITLEELNESNIIFDTVKTIAAKNNYLFAGNVKYSDFDLEDFDARAYRFNKIGTAIIEDSQGVPLTVDPNAAPTSTSNWGVPFTHDAINPNQDPFDQNSYLYDRSGNIGGEGPRVKYTFTSNNDMPSFAPLVLDEKSLIGLQGADITNNSTGVIPFSYVNGAAVTVDLGADTENYNNYKSVTTGFNYISPYVQAFYKQYHRDETYRFGIVFYSKKGEKSFVKWIGDIRIPNQWIYRASASSPSLEYPVSLVNAAAANRLEAYPMGVKFTVDVSGYEDQIDAYSIVRVKRDSANKTILSQGILYPAGWNDSISTNPNDWYHTLTYKSSGLYVRDATFSPGGAVDRISYSVASLASPNFEFLGFPGASIATDKVQIISVQTAKDSITVFGDATKRYTIAKQNSLFSDTFNPSRAINVKAAAVTNGDIAGGGSYSFNLSDSGVTHNIYNLSENITGGTGPTGSVSFGNKRVVFSNNGGMWPLTNNVLLDNVAQVVGNTYNKGFTNLYVANYKRNIIGQYGGNTYSQRSFNEYISTGHIRFLRTGITSYTDYVYGGDTYITQYDTVQQFPNSGSITGTTFDNVANFGDAIFAANFVALESEVNTLWRISSSAVAPRVPNRDGVKNSPDSDITSNEYFAYESGFDQENSVMKFYPAPVFNIPNNKFDVRVFKSAIKTNGEYADAWSVFKATEYLDVDTAQGPLNNLMILQDKLIGFQDRGISVLSVNERAITQDANQADIILGTSGVLARYDYISKIIGSRHQFSFTASNDAIFWFDMNTKNMYKMQGVSPSAISVAKGMTSWFNNNLGGLIQTNDNPYLDKGITATYDFRYNEAIMSFRDTYVDLANSQATSLVSLSGNTYTFNMGLPAWLQLNDSVVVHIKETEESYLGSISSVGISTIDVYIPEEPNITSNNSIIIYKADTSKNKFTIAYNDFIDAYTSFYSYIPKVYVNDQVNIFSPNPSNNQTLYIHDVFDHGRFYDSDPYPSKITFLVNPAPTETKVFDNYEIVSESIDLATGINIVDDLFNTIRLYNDYQNTDFQTMPIDGTKDIAKRKERTWNISNLRNRVLYTTVNPDIFTDLSSPNDKDFGERMRDKYLTVDLVYDNTNNYRYVFHTFKTHYRKSAR